MRKINCSIQHHDFTDESLGEVSFELIESKILNFEWEKQLDKKKQLQQETGDSCPVSFHFGDGRYAFSLYADEQYKYNFMTHIPESKPRKILFVTLDPRILSIEHFNLSLDKCLNILKAYFKGDFKKIEEFDSISQHSKQPPEVKAVEESIQSTRKPDDDWECPKCSEINPYNINQCSFCYYENKIV